MADFERQFFWIEKGKQIGYGILDGYLSSEIAIQKHKGYYKVYFEKRNLEPVNYFDEGLIEEDFRRFTEIQNAVNWIEQKGYTLDQFAPLKGQKIFNPDFY
ncbi:MAG: hypothetical protein K2H29_00990 [Oscillospiraceae bacterium]|nr:hypothetical protein [Oscillospiraceae bacterium]